ncbi:hypothetical protein [Shewanella aestuarii]|uniref:Uncharacterized protein n=1 Tax=Shewanella aestuarii TaxID=1028752 RepID=A0A6G9QR62_9GAMM|nr:hypothetical protein [Shewanella aestuarii]QIR16527.1 hypothetical protein HBH39_18800 [Shewanella aestuarii]
MSAIAGGVIAGAEFGFFFAAVYAAVNWSNKEKWRAFFTLWSSTIVGVALTAMISSGIQVAFQGM